MKTPLKPPVLLACVMVAAIGYPAPAAFGYAGRVTICGRTTAPAGPN